MAAFLTHDGSGWAGVSTYVHTGQGWVRRAGSTITGLAAALGAARPTVFAATYDVGPGRPYATIGAAATAARADDRAWNKSGRYDWGSPYLRRRIRVWPGSYYEYNLNLPVHCALVGMGATPDEVRIWHDAGSAGYEGRDPVTGEIIGGNILVTTGRSAYVSNLWLDHQSDDPEWHSIRDSGPAGEIGLRGRQRRTVFFEDVHMSSAVAGMAGKCAADLTPSGVDMIFHRVHFDTPGQPQAVNGIVNYYKVPGGRSNFLYAGCKVTSSYGWTADPTLPNNGYDADGSPGDPAPVGLPDFGAASGDRLWWIETGDSAWDFGSYGQPYQGSAVVVKKDETRYNAELHLDPAIPAPPDGAPDVRLVTTHTTGPAPDSYTAYGVVDRVVDKAALPFPVADGMGAAEQAFYGPDPAVSPAPAALTTGEAASTGTVPGGRVYWVPVPVGSSMVRSEKVRLTSDAGVGVAFATAYEDEAKPGEPYRTAAGQMWKTNELATTTGGEYAINPRLYYPGHGTVWVAVAFTAATEAQCGTVRAGGPTIWYTDGYTNGPLPDTPTVTALPVGSVYPLVSVVNTLV